MSPTISCVVPVYNGSEYLSEALDSILAETCPVAEIILVDDGSTDTTPAVAARYSQSIRYIRQENRGPAAARNTGLRACGGEFISFLDADDTWHPKKIELQMEALRADGEAGICLVQVQNFWIEALAQERDRLKDHPFSKPVLGYVCQALLARREVFDRVGGFDDTLKIGEDTDWFGRARAAGIRQVALEKVLVNRRIHGRNISFEMYRSQEARAALLENVIRHRKQQRKSAS